MDSATLASPAGCGPAVVGAVVSHAAACVAVGRRRANVVHYFFRGEHGTDTEKPPQGREAPGLGRSLSLRPGAQSPGDSKARESSGREAQDTAQNPLDRE